MIFFSAIELINKAFGLLITGLLARILSQQDYGAYITGLIIFGYALEFSMFASQNRHNADYSRDSHYLQTPAYRARRGLTMLTTCIGCLGLLLSTSNIQNTFSILPLLLILPLAPFTFDYIAYAQRRSKVIVLARFLSQLLALLWIVALMQDWVHKNHLYWGNFLQSLLMMLVVTLFLLHLKLMPSSTLLAGIVRERSTPGQLLRAAREQAQALSLRMLTLALVSGELILLGLLQSDLKGDFAIAIRIIQILYPFVVFYVDSKISEINLEQFEHYYLRAIFAIALLMVFLSPGLVLLLFGSQYRDLVFTVSLFIPAFLLQAVAQYFLLLTLKGRGEKNLIALLASVNSLGIVLCWTVVHLDLSINYVAAILSIKAAVLFLSLHELSINTKYRALSLLSGLIGTTVILEYLNYYQHVISMLNPLLELFK